MYDPPAVPPSAHHGPGAPADAAPRARRLAAGGIDAALLLGVAILLGMMTWGRLNGVLGDGLWGRALSATGGLLLSGGDVKGAAADFGMGIWQDIVNAITQALLLLVLIELLYRFAAERLTGRTLGKVVLDLRVESAGPGGPRAFRRALVTTAGCTGLYCVAWVLLLQGLFLFSLLTWLAAVGVFVANGLPALAGARRRTLADLAGGTAVVPAGGYRRAAKAARQGAGAAWTGTQAAGRAVRGNAGRLAQDDRVRRALESGQARHVQDLGRQSAARVRGAMGGERARRAQEAAAEAGKRIGGRLRGVRSDRQAAPEPPALPAPEPHYDPYPQQNPYAQQNQQPQQPQQNQQPQQQAQNWWPPPAPPPPAPPPPGQGR